MFIESLFTIDLEDSIQNVLVYRNSVFLRDKNVYVKSDTGTKYVPRHEQFNII